MDEEIREITANSKTRLLALFPRLRTDDSSTLINIQNATREMEEAHGIVERLEQGSWASHCHNAAKINENSNDT